MRALRSCFPILALSALACARPAPTATAPLFPAQIASSPAGLPAPGQEGLTRTAPEPAPALAKSGLAFRPRDGLVPGKTACLEELAQRGVAFRPRDSERGVVTPVVVAGPIGAVRFVSDSGPLVADCRLILALSDLAPLLAEQGVTQLRFSGAYVYRTKRSGRLSLHAHGLAIDIHDVWFGGERYTVKKDFARGLGRECRPGLPPLNALSCRVREQRLFKEHLTPDDNADHHDHFHFGLAPLPGEFAEDALPVRLPQPVRKVPAKAEPEELPPLDDGVPAPSPAPAIDEQPREPAAAPVAPAPQPAPAPAEDAPGSLPEVLPDAGHH